MAATLIHHLSNHIEDPFTSEFVIEKIADLPNSDIYDYLLELVYSSSLYLEVLTRPIQQRCT